MDTQTFVSKLNELTHPNGNMAHVDGIAIPEPRVKVRQRERRMMSMVVSFLANGGNTFPDGPKRVDFGSWDLCNNAILVGRLFSFLARVVEGLPTTADPNSPPLQFHESCVSFAELKDDALYASGVVGALLFDGTPLHPGDCDAKVNRNAQWKLDDEVYHYARGVQAYFSGLLCVGDELETHVLNERVVMHVDFLGPDDALSGPEQDFTRLSFFLESNNGGVGITRRHEVSERKTLAAYVGYHTHSLRWTVARLHQTERARKRPNPSSVPMDDVIAMVQNELDAGEGDAAKSAGGAAASSKRSKSSRSELLMYQTNAPNTIGMAGTSERVGVYQPDETQAADFATYEEESELLKAEIEKASTTNGGVGLFLSNMSYDQDYSKRPGSAETEEERTERLQRRLRSLRSNASTAHIVVDLRTPEQASAEETEYAVENTPTVFHGGRASPQDLWKHSQTLLSELISVSNGAAVDKAFEEKYKDPKLSTPAELSSLKNNERWPARSTITPPLLALKSGRENSVYGWNDNYYNSGEAQLPPAPPPPPNLDNVRAAREFMGTMLPPLPVGDRGTKGPSRSRRQRSFEKQSLLRMPVWVNAGSSLENAVEVLLQYLYSARHGVGVYVSFAIVFDTRRMYNTAEWDKHVATLRAIRPQIGDLNVLPPSGSTTMDARYGVVMLVEKMDHETDRFAEPLRKQPFFQPAAATNSIGKDVGELNVSHALCSLWELLSRMSMRGVIFFDFHLGNVMFNIRNGSYVAKLIDFDSKYGTVLTGNELYGPEGDSTGNGWKALFVINSLMCAFTVASDESRPRLFQTWMASDTRMDGTKLSGAALDVGQLNRFKRIVDEVKASVSTAGAETSLSVPERLLRLEWKGGFKGTGEDVKDWPPSDSTDPGQLATRERLRADNAFSMSDAEVHSKDTHSRMVAALRTNVYYRGFYDTKNRLAEAWSRRQRAIGKFLRSQPLEGESVYLSYEQVAMLASKSLSSDTVNKLVEDDAFIRHVFPNVLGPCLRHVGTIRSTGKSFLDLTAEYVFTNPSLRSSAFEDPDYLSPFRAPTLPFSAADKRQYDESVEKRLASIKAFSDESMLGTEAMDSDSVQPTGGQ